MTDLTHHTLLRIEELECKLAFQEQHLDELNQALSHQQLMLAKQQEQLKYLAGKLTLLNGSQVIDASQETPPPHY